MCLLMYFSEKTIKYIVFKKDNKNTCILLHLYLEKVNNICKYTSECPLEFDHVLVNLSLWYHIKMFYIYMYIYISLLVCYVSCACMNMCVCVCVEICIFTCVCECKYLYFFVCVSF